MLSAVAAATVAVATATVAAAVFVCCCCFYLHMPAGAAAARGRMLLHDFCCCCGGCCYNDQGVSKDATNLYDSPICSSMGAASRPFVRLIKCLLLVRQGRVESGRSCEGTVRRCHVRVWAIIAEADKPGLLLCWGRGCQAFASGIQWCSEPH